MDGTKWYNDLTNDDDYWVESVKIDFAVSLQNRMQADAMLKKDLAEKLGVSGARITKVLRGDANLTLESMVRLARACGGNLHVHISPAHAEVRWFDVFSSGNAPKVIEPSAKAWASAHLQPRQEPLRYEA